VKKKSVDHVKRASDKDIIKNTAEKTRMCPMKISGKGTVPLWDCPHELRRKQGYA